jgi:undecaprenyl-diphosphatase
VNARDPADLGRLLISIFIAGVGLIAARGAEQTTAGIEADLVEAIGRLPAAIVGGALVAVQVLYLVLLLVVPVALVVLRNWRLLGRVVLGYVVCAIATTLAVDGLITQSTTPLPETGLGERANDAWPPTHGVATTLTVLIVLTPVLNRAWRRFGWAFVATLAVLRIITARDVVLDLVLALGIGGLVGYGILVLLGRRHSRPGPADVAAALRRLHLDPVSVAALPPTSHESLPFTAALADGSRAHCKVLAPWNVRADSLQRTYRRVRTRGLGEEVPYSTVRRAAAVEAMLGLAAARAGVTTPELLGVAPLPDDEMLLAFRHLDGHRLAEQPDLPDRLTDEVLDTMWSAVAALRAAGLAHRDLGLDSWLVDEAGRVHLVDFSFGEPAASDGALRADVAELLAATYAVVGAERAAAAALRGIGPDALAEGIGHLVPAALSRRTRSGVKAAGGLEPLVAAASAAAGVVEPQFAAIERVKPRTLVMAGLLAVAIYVLLPQLTDLPRMIEAVREADVLLVLAVLGASLATYIGTALSLSGSIPAPVRFVHSLEASVAATFVGAVAPPGVAHVGLNVRFAQKQGLSAPQAVSATASKEVAMIAVHLALLVLFAFAAGSTGALQAELAKLPSGRTLLIGAAIALAAVGLAAAVPQVRRIVTGSVLPALRHSVDSIRALLADPLRLLVIFVGALMLQMGYIGALYFAQRALGGEITLVAIGLLYLTVGSAASIAPTPGGVGAVEAVLLTGLTGLGMAAAPALAAVFVYRFATFWLPIPIGGVTMRHMIARDLL